MRSKKWWMLKKYHNDIGFDAWGKGWRSFCSHWWRGCAVAIYGSAVGASILSEEN
jgi:hypothetical protein